MLSYKQNLSYTMSVLELKESGESVLMFRCFEKKMYFIKAFFPEFTNTETINAGMQHKLEFRKISIDSNKLWVEEETVSLKK